MLVRCLRSSFAVRRFFCSSPVGESSISSTVGTGAVKPTKTEVPAEKVTNLSKLASSVRGSLSRRLLKKSNSESAATVIAKWREEGGVVSMLEFLTAFRGLFSVHRYADALAVRDYMLEVKDLELESRDYASHISLISRVHGLQSVEMFFDRIPEEMKDRFTSIALLQAFVTAGETTKAEALLEEMKKSGYLTSYHSYIYMLSLYLSKEQFDKAEEIITELKRVIPPKDYIYNKWLSACASAKDVKGVEKAFAHMKEAKVEGNWETHAILADLYIEKKLFEKAGAALKEMEDVAPCTSSDSCSLIGMHGKMGNKDEVIRIWNKYKSKSGQNDKVYDSVVRSLAELGMFEKAGEIFTEWESIVRDASNPLFLSASNFLKNYEKEGKMSHRSILENAEEGNGEMDVGSEGNKFESQLG